MRRSYFFTLMIMLLLSGCMVGPKYNRPGAPTSTAYKEPLPAGWKEAQPSDGAIRGKWWELYNDPALNALEEQVSISNQSFLAAEAQFRAAREAVRIARAALFPTVSTSPSITSSKPSGNLINNQTGRASVPGVRTNYTLPLDLSYQADIWGSVRRNIRATADNAQASAAQLENARLTFQAELAQDYFQLHGTDRDEELLATTVKSYEEFLHLTQNRLSAGVASGGDVALAQTQLENARAQLIDLGLVRAQLEHGIAILIGKPPAAVTIGHSTTQSPPPAIPVSVPSALLERRPDIAAAERQMAAANEQIGIAKAAFFPTLSISASARTRKLQYHELVRLAKPLLVCGAADGRDALRCRAPPRPGASDASLIRCHGCGLSPGGTKRSPASGGQLGRAASAGGGNAGRERRG